jgi:hypothetical protein
VPSDPLEIDELEWRFRGAEAEWYERHTVSQNLPELATDALVAGWDTQSLRVLAGESPNAFPHDLGDLFARALKELERPVLSPAQARSAFARYLAWLTVTERVSPLDGAKRIERIHVCEHPELPELAYMSGLVDEWEGEWGRPRPEVEEEIRRNARALLGTQFHKQRPGWAGGTRRRRWCRWLRSALTATNLSTSCCGG